MTIKLPTPIYKGKVSLEEAIYKRVSRRRFVSRSLTQGQLSQLLWVTQGRNEHSRAVPSAGATYPLEVMAVIGGDCVEGVSGGIYWYRYDRHLLDLHKQGDLRKDLSHASWDQDFISAAPISIVMLAEFERTASRYGRRGYQYVYMEIGHVGQNIYLGAEALGLGTVAVGAFNDEDVRKVLEVPKELEPLYIMPVGYAK